MLVLGPYDRYAKLLRQALDVELTSRSGNLRIQGGEEEVGEARARIEHLLGKARKGRELGVREIESILLGKGEGVGNGNGGVSPRPMVSPWRGTLPLQSKVRVRPVEPRNENQRRYMEAIAEHDLVFGSGAAGTGKTFLAVAAAVRLLRQGEVRRLVITRPVVEAGEHLGFLQAKLNPYMRPIYDALFELIEHDDLARLEEANVIEVAPLAYMRGRTLSHAFVILDEAQNTTIEQMKMFLTRLGFGTKAVITGDVTQIDLPSGRTSGLVEAMKVVSDIEGISFVYFDDRDVVRHKLVQQIVKAYEAFSNGNGAVSPRPRASS